MVGTSLDFARSVFLCSKPLQVLNCASIVRHFGITDARLHVVTSAIDDAAGFRSFVDDSGCGAVFSTISWPAEYGEALGALDARDYDSLFVDDDRVGRYRMFVPYRTERRVVYEEGIGTYRSNPAMSLRGLRRLKWRTLAVTTGCGWDFGGGRRTDAVLVSRPDAFARLQPRLARKAIGFPGLIDELDRHPDAWRRAVLPALGHPEPPLGRVALVLAQWGRTPTTVLTAAAEQADVVFYKAHPHDGAGPPTTGAVEVAGSWIPAEVLVEVLAGMCDHLTVYHHSSSVAFYTRGRHGRVEMIDVLGSEQLRTVLAALTPA